MTGGNMDEKKPMLSSEDKEKALSNLQKGRYDLSEAEFFVAYGTYRLTLIEDEKIPTLCTDGQVMWYNPSYVLRTRTPDVPAAYWAMSMVEHEGWHPMLGHCRDWTKEVDAEGDPYDARLANTAQDHVINNIIKSSGRRVHPTWLCDERFNGMPWKEVYLILKKERKAGKAVRLADLDCLPQPAAGGGDGESEDESEDKEKKSGSGGGKGKSDGGDPNKDAKGKGGSPGGDDSDGDGKGDGDKDGGDEQPHNDWDQIVVEAAQVAQSMGKLPGYLKQYADKVKRPEVDWRPIVARWFSRMKRGDFSYRRPNKKYLREGIVMPSPYSYSADLLVALDTSGSVWAIVSKFMREVFWIGKTLGVPFDVSFTDDGMHGCYRMRKPDDVRRQEAEGGGGTDFKPFFDWLKKQRRYDAVVFFTDGYATYPERKPNVPVLWCVTHGGQKPPWGEVLWLPERFGVAD